MVGGGTNTCPVAMAVDVCCGGTNTCPLAMAVDVCCGGTHTACPLAVALDVFLAMDILPALACVFVNVFYCW